MTKMKTKTKMKSKARTKPTTTIPLTLLALLAACGASGCDRAHLTASYGRANHEAFNRQIANPGAATQPAPGAERKVQGLDSQEAAIVSQTYRRNLAPRQDESTARDQLLYQAPRPAQSDRGDLPPPSVPQPR